MTPKPVSARSNVRWVAFSQGARVGLQILTLVVLARLLEPGDFGVVALAVMVTNLANVVRDMGTAAALIQKRDLTDEVIASTFWFNLAFGTGLCAIVLVLAPIMASMFRVPSLTGVLSALSAAFPIASSAAVHQALMERDSQFEKLAKIEVAGAAVAFGVAIGAALTGAGPYSLVLHTLSIAAVSTIILWLASPWRPRWHWSGDAFKEVRAFGTRLAGFNVVNYVSRNIDSAIIGRLLGPHDLGVYSLAYRVMLFPVQNLTFVMNRSLFPVMSHRPTDQREAASLYLRTVSLIAFISAPVMAGVWGLREPFCEIVFGSQWPELAGLIGWLAPVGVIQSVVSTTGMVMMAKGHTGLLLSIGIVGALMFTVAFLVGVRFGLQGVVIAYLGANLLNAAVCFPMTAKVLEVNPIRLIATIAAPVALALLMAAGVRFASNWLAFQGYSSIIQLTAGVLLGVLLYVTVSLAIAKPQLNEIRRMLKRT